MHERVREPVAIASRPCPTCWIRSDSTRRSSAASAASLLSRNGIGAGPRRTSLPAPPPPEAGAGRRRAAGRCGRGAARAAWAERSIASQAAVHVQRSPWRTSTPLLTRLRTISSTNSGLPPARVATKSCDPGESIPVHRAEQAAHERPRLVGGERGEPDDGLRGPGDDGGRASGRCESSIINGRSAR